MVVHRFGSVLTLAAVAALCTACSGTPTGPGPTASSPSGQSLYGATVEGFKVVEYSEGGKWFYAPKLKIVTGKSAVIVTRVSVTIPGLDHASDVCGAIVIYPATTKDLFLKIRDEYEFAIEAQRRSTGGTATAEIEMLEDWTSDPATLSVDGPIEPGDAEAGHGGGSGSWGACS